MKNYDAVVIGSGSGMSIAEEATNHGMKVAVIDKGPLVGGTCLNLGCIPSKMLIYIADRIVEIQEAEKFGIGAVINSVDFSTAMERMRNSRQESQKHIRAGIAQAENLDFYEGEGHFTADYTVEVNGENIRGDKIFIASGSRPFVPPIQGVAYADYLTNETVLELTEKPQSLIIIGGGYIAVEYGHFFAAMGTEVTVLEMMDRLVLSEEPEIAELLRKKLDQRMEIHTGTQVKEIAGDKHGGKVTIMAVDSKTGKEQRFTAQKIMMAVGRRSNADILKVENTGVETDKKGFIKVNEYMETNMKNIFAVGDANGQQMFTHVANREAAIVARNVFHDSGLKMDYTVIPHAVYSYPQIASVGLQEAEARREHEVLIAKTSYHDTAKGEAMMEKEGFAKAIVEKDSEKILGFHIIGPVAPILIQEVVNAMTSGGHIDEINQSIHIHPALSELIGATLNSIE